MIRKFHDYSGDIEEACDICVIGSWAGGSVAVKEISGRGYSVVLIEEGGYYTKED